MLYCERTRRRAAGGVRGRFLKSGLMLPCYANGLPTMLKHLATRSRLAPRLLAAPAVVTRERRGVPFICALDSSTNSCLTKICWKVCWMDSSLPFRRSL